VAGIIAAGIVPATLEMIDSKIIQAVEDSYVCGYPRDAAAVLIIEVEGPVEGLGQQADRIREICTANNCREIRDAASAEERGRLWEGRRGAFGAVARLAPNYLVNDCTVPRTLLPKALAQVAEIVKRHGFEHGNVFHAGDGNLHPLILFDSRDADQLKRVHEAGWEIMQACVGLGGTISGEHGIGLEKMEAMRLVFSDADIGAQRSLQEAFDPARILNPGKIFPDTSQPFALASLAAWAGADDALSAVERYMADRVRQAFAAGEALLPIGGGSMPAAGNLPSRATTPLRTQALAGMIELDAANQYFTAGAGMTLGAIQEALAPHQQWLPLRPALAVLGRTIGGIAATGAFGPERLAYGAPRELLLGLRFVDGRGRPISAGGRVVKNVAGYDMTRLIAGSAGTLGLITRVTMKTATRPERCALASACGGPEACGGLATQVLGSSLGAAFVAAAPDNGGGSWRLSIGFEGFSETVDAQLSRARSLFEKAGFHSAAAEAYDVLTGPFGGLYERITGCRFIVRMTVPPDKTAEAAAILLRETRAEELLVDFGSGRILAGSSELADAAWQAIGRRQGELGGHAVLEKSPDEFRELHDVFGPLQPEWSLMHRVKAILDPKHVFAPGRMPGRV
jgi:FAD/FMN-containing dehydrogenase